jgi:mRNA-degrading endonuclease RelE of RelBE toxin-antitoxin system
VTERPYHVEVVPRAARDLEQLPGKIAAACVEFIFSTQAVDPYRVSKPLFRELAGQRAARRGSYRIVFRISDAARLIEVLRISHRAHAYRGSLGGL